MKNYYYYKINNYDFTIASFNKEIILVKMDREKLNYSYGETKVIKEAKKELVEYFEGIRTTFQIPIKLEGTEFQKRVLETMKNIPYGETICYQKLAEMAGYPKAARAVGNVCHINPIMIIIPCHRVTAKKGLGGFGLDLNMKIKLLELEGNLR